MRTIENPYVGGLGKNPVIAKYFGAEEEDLPELWSTATMAAYQTEALRLLVSHAYENSSYYKDKFDRARADAQIASVADVASLPFTYKEELRRRPWKLLAVDKEEICQVHMSTGTTSEAVGDHIYSLLSWDDIYLNEVAARCPLMMPHKRGDVVVVALPYEMSSAGFSMHRAYHNTMRCIVVNAGKGGFYSDPAKTMCILKDLRADILCTTPSYAMYLWEVARERGVDPQRDVGLKLMWLGGEGCSNAFRRRLESLWGCRCLRYYSSLECGPMGIECAAQGGLHVPENYNLVEVIDPTTGKPAPDRTPGELCMTVLYRFGAPLIRYRTQDIGWIDRAPCRCCVERPRLFLKGRARDQIHVAGQSYSPYDIEDRIYELEAMGGAYVIVVGRDGVRIEVEVRPGYDKGELQRQIVDRLRDYGLTKVEVVDSIPRSHGKAVRVRHESPS